MKVHILDDTFDTLRTLPCFAKLAGHDVTVWTDHVQDMDTLAARLHDAEVLVLFRERTAIRAPLLERLPNLRLISQRSVYPHIDVADCTRLGVIVSSEMHAGTPSYAAAELTWGLDPGLHAADPAADGGAAVRAMADGRRPDPARADPGHPRLRADRRRGRRLRPGLRHAVLVWARDANRARAAADGYDAAPSREAFYEACDVVSLHMRLVDATRGIVTAARPGAHEAGRPAGQHEPRRAGRAWCAGGGAACRSARHGRGGCLRARTSAGPGRPAADPAGKSSAPRTSAT